MDTPDRSRRSMLKAAAWLTGAALSFTVWPHRLAAGSRPPFPVRETGLITGHSLQTYSDNLRAGGVGRDGIPSIDRPRYRSAADADGFLQDDDIVFGMLEGGIPRAYPQRIMVRHEVVNETVEGQGIAITYCPLVGDVMIFERGDTEFGVSGWVVNSNLVLYDRDTDTCFPQILATGVRGPHTGRALIERPIVWTTWRRWRAAYPETVCLSTDTDTPRNYFEDPYGNYNPLAGYYAPDTPPMFAPLHTDGRFPAKRMFLGARTADSAVAIDMDALRGERRIEIETAHETFTAVYDAALDTGYIFRGRTSATAVTVRERLPRVTWDAGPALEPCNAFQAMWFAWVAYYPDIVVYA